MSATYRMCRCGKGWDSHGIYSTCPFCAKGSPDQRAPTPEEIETIRLNYERLMLPPQESLL